MEFFKRTKIRIKLLLAFGSVILLSVFLTVYALYSINRILRIENLNKASEKLSISLEQLELAANSFIFEGFKDPKFQESGRSDITERVANALYAANEQLTYLAASNYIHNDTIKKQLIDLQTSTAITNGFEEIKSLLKTRGFKDYGLEGSLRRAIHKIEKSSLPYDRALMLTLRRHEKDFFLRKDLKYQKEFNETIATFSASLNNSKNEELLNLLTNYQAEFNQVVEIEKKIGLTTNEGKKGELYENMHSVRVVVAGIHDHVYNTTNREIETSKILLLIIFGVQFISAIALAITYSHSLTTTIKEIKFTMTQLANGLFPSPLRVTTLEEIGQTKIAINQFLDRLKVATDFAGRLGNGELHSTYDNRYNNDVFAQALITMQQKLYDAEQAQAKINWTNKGLAIFNEVANNDTEDLATIGDKITKLLVQYLQANQGALYITNSTHQTFSRLSTFAYGKKKFIEDEIPFGNGLIGQCALEQQTLLLKEIPADYVKITSGLGSALPSNIVIAPLLIRGEVMGVLELASFELFENHHITFIEKIAESIAFILVNRQSAEQTKILLAEAEAKTKELLVREEQIRQNSEELLATQEEMERQRDEMQREIKLLREKANQHEEQLA
jgi:putative methionine-R-sulfoxide reductase with GAF domain